MMISRMMSRMTGSVRCPMSEPRPTATTNPMPYVQLEPETRLDHPVRGSAWLAAAVPA